MIKSHYYSSTIHHFDAVKWKKRLIKLSHKLHRLHNNNNNHHHWNATSSATVMAAAKEKFIRHSSPTSSDIVIHSEDLTASQFANLTGINSKSKRNSIYSNQCSPDYDEEEMDSDEDEDDDEDSRDYYYYSTASLPSSSNNNRQHQPATMRIWDSHFWQDNSHQRKSLPTNIPSITLTSATSMNNIATTSSKPLTSQPLSRHVSEPGGARVPSMIQKGRFKIVWGNDDDTEPITAPESHCVEWKRKRAGSSSTCASTPTSN